MNEKQAVEYIHSVNWTFCKPGLERISYLCERLGNPQRELRFVHVAGTNGKGSFCAMTASILKESGLRVGLYTSPYLRFFNERMCVDGEPISGEELAELTATVRPIADAMTDRPTEFELITAIAFLYFKRKKCDVVVLEAGMGGRLDSTNVIRHPLLSVITGIALDHTAFLGDTPEKIAAEKAGIIKDGAPVLWGGDHAGAERVIRETAEKKGSRFFKASPCECRVTRADLTGASFSFGERTDLGISLLGLYQPRNASLAVFAADLLREQGMPITEESLRRGLERASWPGRFERLCEDPLLIFDGAHNPQGIASAVESIRHYFPDRKVFVLSGVLRDKDYDAIATDLSEVACRAFTMTPDNPRALPAEEYAKVFAQKGVKAQSYPSLPEALAAALAEAKKTSTPLFCLGSLYVYAELVEALEKLRNESK